MNIYKHTLTLLFIFSLNFFNAQTIDLPKNITSPTTSGLGKYGDVPVSLYYGQTNINIPIYSMNVLDVPLNISLNYDSSGIRVNSTPGWVGQNWSLSCGGLITRQVNGEYDEINNSESPHPQGRGYFYPISHSRLNVSNWSDLTQLANIQSTNTNYSQGAYLEAEPDVFTFNFMGMSGKFFLGEDGLWKVASETNLKVNILASDFIYPLDQKFINSSGGYQCKSIGKIELIDDKGNKYIFGCEYPTNTGIVKAIEFSKDFFGQATDDWVAVSWYLVKVKNSQNETLYDFEYERNSSYNANFYNYQTNNKYTFIFNPSGLFPTNGCEFNNYSVSPPGSLSSISGSLISDVYLKKIITKNNEILNFNSDIYDYGNYKDTSSILSNYITGFLSQLPASESPKVLWNLQPYSSSNEVLNKIKQKRLLSITRQHDQSNIVNFNYNSPTYSNTHNERLNLLNINLSVNKKYVFEYDRFNELPAYLSRKEDHLGYNNGTEYPFANSSNFNTYYNFRNTNIDKVKIGSLVKIIYPTKGYTEFEYEPHQYSKYITDDKSSINSINNTIIGGLRIKKIKNNDNNGNIEIKEYKYVKDFVSNSSSLISSGIISNIPKYYWEDWDSKDQMSGGIVTRLRLDTFSTNPIIPLGNFFGAPVTYDEVTELNSDGSFINYKYTNHEDFKDEVYVSSYNKGYSPYEKYNDRSLLRGKLKEQKSFNSNGTIVKKSIYEYSTNDSSNIKYVKGTNVRGITCPSGSQGYGVLIGNAYKIYYFDNDLINEYNYTYFDNNEIKEKNSLFYQYYPNLNNSFGDRFLKSSTKEIYLQEGNTNAEILKSELKYPFDNNTTINSELISRRMFPILITNNFKNNEPIGSNKLEYSHFLVYNCYTNFSTIANDYLLPSKTYYAKDNLNYLEELIIDAYDRNGNITEYHNINGMFTTLLYSYYGKYPVAKIEGTYINPNNFQLLGFNISTLVGNNGAFYTKWLTNHSQINNSLSNIRSSYPDHMVTTYTYNPFLGIHSTTDPKGYTTYYEYNGDGNLSTTRDNFSNIISTNNYHFKSN